MTGRHRLARFAYRLLLRRYPARIRERFGDDMVEAFSRRLDEAQQASGLRGSAAVWLWALRDLVRRVPPPLPAQRSVPGPLPPGRGSSGPAVLAQEAGAAVRRLLRAPAYTALSVGITTAGVTTALLAAVVLESYLLRPLPYPEPDRLVSVRPASEAVGWRTTRDVFERAAAWDLAGFTLVGDPGADLVLGARVSPDFDELFGVEPAIGRFFSDAEAAPGGAPVVVISHGLWTRRFGRDPEVIGRAITYHDGEANRREVAELIGVLPADFWHLNGYTDVLLPLREDAPITMGRLARGLTPAAARARLDDRTGGTPDERITLTSLHEAYTARARPRVLLFQLAGGLVFLVALVNGLLLALLRMETRAPETHLRRALGAGRGRAALGPVLEGITVTLLALAGGAALAWALLAPLQAGLAGLVGVGVPGGSDTLRIGPASLVALAVMGAALALGFALVGALGAVPTGSESLRGGVASGRSTGARRGRRMRGGLMALEVALSATLLAGGVFLVQSNRELGRIDPGFDTRGLEVITVGLTGPRYDDVGTRLTFFHALAEGLHRRPEVTAVALARGAPLTSGLTARRVVTAPEPGRAASAMDAVPQIASPELFDLLGLTPIAGRLRPLPDPGSAAIGRSVAERLWPDEPVQQAVGRRLRFEAWSMPEMTLDPGPWLTVSAVVPDVHMNEQGAAPVVYLPFETTPSRWMDLLIRVPSGRSPTDDDIRSVIGSLDPGVPLYSRVSVDGATARNQAPIRLAATMFAGFAAVTFALSILGFYGVTTWAARRNRRSVAIRVALGARPDRVGVGFAVDALPWLALGLLAGAIGGGWLGQILVRQMPTLASANPWTGLALVLTVLAVAGLVAVWLPARRVAGSDLRATLEG